MRAVKSILAYFLLFSLLTACGGGGKMAKYKSDAPCPDWFTNLPQDTTYLYSAATATSTDLQLAIDKAKQSGRVDIASQFEVRMKSMFKQFQQELGTVDDPQMSQQFTSVSKAVVSNVLYGCKAKYQVTKREGNLWRACVLMEYPMGEANARLLSMLKQQKLLNQKLAATRAFQELEEEVAKYEQEKQMGNKNE